MRLHFYYVSEVAAHLKHSGPINAHDQNSHLCLIIICQPPSIIFLFPSLYYLVSLSRASRWNAMVEKKPPIVQFLGSAYSPIDNSPIMRQTTGFWLPPISAAIRCEGYQITYATRSPSRSRSHGLTISFSIPHFIDKLAYYFMIFLTSVPTFLIGMCAIIHAAHGIKYVYKYIYTHVYVSKCDVPFVFSSCCPMFNPSSHLHGSAVAKSAPDGHYARVAVERPAPEKDVSIIRPALDIHSLSITRQRTFIVDRHLK